MTGLRPVQLFTLLLGDKLVKRKTAFPVDYVSASHAGSINDALTDDPNNIGESQGMGMGRLLGKLEFDAALANLRAIDTELAGYFTDYVFGTVMARGILSLRERESVIVAALTAVGQLPQLKWHINAGINIGLTPDELREIIIHCIPFSGWPAGLNALMAFKEVLQERNIASEIKSKNVRTGATGDESCRERGRKNGARIYADYDALEAAVRQFDDSLPDYLTDNVFGQFYDRPGISIRTRQLTAIGLLAALQRLPQLLSHIKGAHRVGCTAEETKEAIILTHLYVGWPAMLNAMQVWQAATKSEA